MFSFYFQDLTEFSSYEGLTDADLSFLLVILNFFILVYVYMLTRVSWGQ